MNTLHVKENLRRATAVVALSAGAVACGGKQEVQEPFCTFSTETTVATVERNYGKNDILLQIAGVDLGTCLNSAEEYVEELNGQQINAPRWDDTIAIPVSAEFHPGS